jgi:hypothetical protein
MEVEGPANFGETTLYFGEPLINFLEMTGNEVKTIVNTGQFLMNRLELFVEEFSKLFKVDIRHRVASIMGVSAVDCQDVRFEPIERCWNAYGLEVLESEQNACG